MGPLARGRHFVGQIVPCRLRDDFLAGLLKWIFANRGAWSMAKNPPFPGRKMPDSTNRFPSMLAWPAMAIGCCNRSLPGLGTERKRPAKKNPFGRPNMGRRTGEATSQDDFKSRGNLAAQRWPWHFAHAA